MNRLDKFKVNKIKEFLITSNLTYKQIAEIIGCSSACVRMTAIRLGLIKPKTRRPFIKNFELPDKDSLIYFAGMLDADGNIKFDKWKGRDYQRRIGVRVANTSKELAEWLKKKFGSNYYASKPYSFHQEIVYHWQTYDRFKAYIILKSVLPYLIVKRKQAEKVIRFLEEKYPILVEYYNRKFG